MFKISLLSLLAISSVAQGMMTISPSKVQTALNSRGITLHRDNNTFIVEKDGSYQNVKNYDVDPIVRNMNEQQFKAFLSCAKLSLNQYDNGDYKIIARLPLKGGGAGGAAAGAWLGKFLTYAVGYGVVNTVAAMSGPAAVGVVPAANIMAAPVIEGASNVVAITFGIIGGLITGPV